MALDWNKQISFSGLSKAVPRKKRDVYPSKTYMNFTVTDQKTVDFRRTVPLVIVLVVAVALFLKFGVFDFIGQVNAKQAELAQQQSIEAGYRAQLQSYDDVLAKYQSFVSTQRASDSSTVSALEALNLVDELVAPVATVKTVDYKDNTLSLSLTGISLQGVGDLVSALNKSPIVKNVAVPTAVTGGVNGGDAVTTVTVTLGSEEGK